MATVRTRLSTAPGTGVLVGRFPPVIGAGWAPAARSGLAAGATSSIRRRCRTRNGGGPGLGHLGEERRPLWGRRPTLRQLRSDPVGERSVLPALRDPSGLSRARLSLAAAIPVRYGRLLRMFAQAAPTMSSWNT